MVEYFYKFGVLYHREYTLDTLEQNHEQQVKRGKMTCLERHSLEVRALVFL